MGDLLGYLLLLWGLVDLTEGSSKSEWISSRLLLLGWLLLRLLLLRLGLRAERIPSCLLLLRSWLLLRSRLLRRLRLRHVQSTKHVILRSLLLLLWLLLLHVLLLRWLIHEAECRALRRLLLHGLLLLLLLLGLATHV